MTAYLWLDLLPKDEHFRIVPGHRSEIARSMPDFGAAASMLRPVLDILHPLDIVFYPTQPPEAYFFVTFPATNFNGPMTTSITKDGGAPVRLHGN
jgi:hypothetical protein